MTDTCAYLVNGEPCGVTLAGHRPYSRKRDGIPSSTALASVLDGGKSTSFGWAAAGITAEMAVHRGTEWRHLSVTGCDHAAKNFCQACRVLRSEFDRQWSAKADLGTHVHHLAHSWAEGDTVDADPAIDPYLDALGAFYDECAPTWVHLEATVENDDPAWRGQFDAIADVLLDGERKRTLIDYKSGSLHFAAMAIQLTSYRRAKWVTTWEDGAVVERKPMPEVDASAVLMLRPDGEYRLIELPTVHDRLLSVYADWEFQREMDKAQKAWEKAEKDQIKEGVAA